MMLVLSGVKLFGIGGKRKRKQYKIEEKPHNLTFNWETAIWTFSSL
jgi:hypothetical protein